MTAAVPDPRFRNQLAKALPESLGPVGLRRRAIPALGVEASVTGYGLVLLDALMPAITAEVEARVQAAAQQRAAEELERAVAEDNISTHRLTPVEVLTLRVVKVEDLAARAAALRAASSRAAALAAAAQPTDDGPT